MNNDRIQPGDYDLKIICPHCGKDDTKIRTSKQIVDNVRELYVDCHNDVCLSRFVCSLSHKHDLQPSLLSTAQVDIVANALRNWSPEQKEQLFLAFQKDELAAAS